jgi:hypothetical protein
MRDAGWEPMRPMSQPDELAQAMQALTLAMAAFAHAPRSPNQLNIGADSPPSAY